MIDVSKTTAPKSDQLNADDLIGGKTITIKITKVSGSSTPDQPIDIHFEGDNGKPFKPCKSMRRVLVNGWGKDGIQYVGKSMRLYCDPKVKFGGAEVGGIRISHMSHLEHDMTMALTASKAVRKAYTVQMLDEVQETKQNAAPFDPAALMEEGRQAAERGTEVLKAFWSRLKTPQQKPLLSEMEGWKKRAAEVDSQPASEDEIPPESLALSNRFNAG